MTWQGTVSAVKARRKPGKPKKKKVIAAPRIKLFLHSLDENATWRESARLKKRKHSILKIMITNIGMYYNINPFFTETFCINWLKNSLLLWRKVFPEFLSISYLSIQHINTRLLVFATCNFFCHHYLLIPIFLLFTHIPYTQWSLLLGSSIL